MARAGIHIEVRGQVQGVGFRPWVYTLATAAGLSGRVWNHAEGVGIEAFGEEEALRRFAESLRHPPAPAARVRELRCEPIAAEHPSAFAVVESHSGSARTVSIPPDWATCDSCLRELADRRDRRHRYPFINCTHCGPRYTICRDVPYDRAQTTMASFALCHACRAEYADPANRRFHAEPNACPACGPRMWLVDAAGSEIDGDALARAAGLLRRGSTVAIKGLGGFHLACDATSSAAVERLRARKRREEKPFAVMVTDLAQAERVADLDDTSRALLAAGERPIVLVRRRASPASAPSCGGLAGDGDATPAAALEIAAPVAPGSPWLGLMLPYTPLHAMLVREVGRPLVMTSANRTDEPMVCDNTEALTRLRDIADAFLLHDREIANRCDDSVAHAIGGRAVVLRRGRGYVPGSLRLPRPVPRPMLACGAHLKNAFCLAQGDRVWIGPHIGDLETEEACVTFSDTVERFARFVGIEPEVIAHDLHPDYFTTRYAFARVGLRRFGVQHHHAHLASCMAENRLDGVVIGLAWDGTGYGSDATAWGGETLLATYAGFRRLATFRPIALAGGDAAIRHVWRSALALLDDAFAGDPPLDRIPLFRNVSGSGIEVIRRMVATRLNAPAAHGVGRFFDAFGAIVLGRTEARYEGQVAVEFGGIATAEALAAYPFEVARNGELEEIDLRPALRAAVADLLDGATAESISTRFHATLVRAGVQMIERACGAHGRHPVVLSGGCFQNPILLEGLRAALPSFDVFTHAEVPPGDGGIALGQIAIVAANP